MGVKTETYAFPLLVQGQGQKEVTVNEALTAIDRCLKASVIARNVSSPPLDPQVGDAWLIPSGASGAWLGKSGEVANYTAGGWRYQDVPLGTKLWIEEEEVFLLKKSSGWVSTVTVEAMDDVPSPTGGTVIDVEARYAIDQLMIKMRQNGLLA